MDKLKAQEQELGQELEQEERNEATLGQPGLSEGQTFMGGGNLVPYLVVLLVAISYSQQYGYSKQMSLKWLPWQ